MGAESAQLVAEKQSDSRGHEINESQAGSEPSALAFDAHADQLFAATPGEPPKSAAHYLSVQGLAAPVLQRAQRAYGNRTAQRMVMRARVAQRQCACGGKCAECQAEQTTAEEETHALQCKSSGGGPGDLDAIPTGAGHALESHTREPLESYFQSDLADVRIHADAAAAESATRIDALAYTTGRDIYFASGMYAPSSSEGQRLLAHEVTHVVQQGAGMVPTIATKVSKDILIGAPDDPLEAEADRAAEEFIDSSDVTLEPERKRGVTASIQRLIQRQEVNYAGPPEVTTGPPPPGPVTDAGVPTTIQPPFAADAGVSPDAIPVVDVTLEDGTILRNEKEFLKKKVRNRIYLNGFSGGRDLLGDLSLFISVNTPTGGTANTEWLQPYIDIRETLTGVVKQVDDENEDFLSKFAADARKVLENVLKDSELRVKSELLRYGITEHVFTEIQTHRRVYHGDEFAFTTAQTHSTFSMDTETPSIKGLAAAAQILLKRRQDINHLQAEQNSHLHTRCFRGDCWDYPDAQYESFTAPIAENSKNYKLLFENLKAQFPVLASFGELNQSAEGLVTLANGPSPEAAEKILGEAKDRLDNIQKTRDGLDTPEGSIWKLLRILNLTKAGRGITDDSYDARLIDLHIDEISTSWLEIALSVIGFAFALLAPFTGGLSLIVTAAISTGIAVEHIQQYQLESAMAGTDFDKAYAIADEPSLFWVALDVVGAVLDVAGAFGVVVKLAKARVLVKAFAPGVKAAQAARTAEEFDIAIRDIEKAAEGFEKGEQAAASVIKKLTRQRAAGGAAESLFGATAEEIGALKAAAESGDVALARTGVLEGAEAAEEGARISKTGELWTCTSPCSMFRERYARALAHDGSILPELEDAERLAKEAASNPENKQLARQARRQARAVEFKLRNVRTPERIEFLGKLKTLQSVHPALAELPAEAFERVLSVRKSLDKATGQLLEEVLNSGLLTREAREASAGAQAVQAAQKAGSEIEFIPGYVLRDEYSRLITDGILGYREGGRFRVVKIFEAKAGEEAAEKLVAEATRLSKAGWNELHKVAAETVQENLLKVRRLTKAEISRLKNMTLKEIEKAYPKEYRKAVGQLITEEAGQSRRTLERLAPTNGRSTTLHRIDSTAPLEVTAGPVSSQVVGVVPANVTPTELLKGLKTQGLNVDIIKAQLTQDELRTMAQSIIDQATKAGI